MSVQAEGLLFAEEQRFRQAWLWWLVGGILAVMVLVFGAAFVYHPEQGSEIIGSAVFGLAVVGGVAVLLYATRLSVQLDCRELRVRYSPFLTRAFPLGRIVRWEARTYQPLREYGGWGIRVWFGSRNWAYNLSGNRGVQLEFADGKRLLIGSQRADEFAAAIAQAKGLRTQDS